MLYGRETTRASTFDGYLASIPTTESARISSDGDRNPWDERVTLLTYFESNPLGLKWKML